MGLLHFCFSFFLGCPDGFQERFFVILGASWAVLGPLGLSLGASWASLGCLLRPSWGSWRPPKSPLGLSFDTLEVMWSLL